jgi:hypothetical protein
MVAKIGRKLLRPYQGEPMFNACTDGRRYLTPAWLKVLGLKKKIDWFFIW